MPKTLLAVDDSATMRKVLEITFAGEEFRVVACENASNALAQMREEPVAALIDTSLGGDDGYALAKTVRARDSRVAIILLTSRYNPYDAARGKDSGADDFVDKPFDTQGLVDKVKKTILARESAKSLAPAVVAPPPVAAPAPAAPVAAPPPAPPPLPAPTYTAPAYTAPAPAPAPSAFARSPAAPPTSTSPASPSVRPVWPTQRTHTLSFEGGVPAPAAPTAAPPSRGPAPIAAPIAAAPVAAPAVTRAPPQPPVVVDPIPHAAHNAATAPPRAPEASIAAATNGHLAPKLGELGLSPQQVEAVLALSREVVERVVWEVVPQLAETIIKEEIARLTKES